MMKYTRMPDDAFSHLQLNAGILVDTFDPATGQIGNILGATSGGVSFNTNPSYEDFGEDVDNCPNNTAELKRFTGCDPTMSGTFLTCTAAVIKDLIGPADVSVTDATKVIPRTELISTDFKDLWWIGDYSDKNTGVNAGCLAIHLKRALNQAGFQIQSGKNAKGTMSFEYHAHYSIANQEDVPFEIYCKAGSEEEDATLYYVMLNKHAINISGTGTNTLQASTNPAGQTVTWSVGDSSVATVSAGVVTGVAAGNTVVTASMTYEGVTYTDTCTVIVSAAEEVSG